MNIIKSLQRERRHLRTHNVYRYILNHHHQWSRTSPVLRTVHPCNTKKSDSFWQICFLLLHAVNKSKLAESGCYIIWLRNKQPLGRFQLFVILYGSQICIVLLIPKDLLGSYSVQLFLTIDYISSSVQKCWTYCADMKNLQS